MDVLNRLKSNNTSDSKFEIGEGGFGEKSD